MPKKTAKQADVASPKLRAKKKTVKTVNAPSVEMPLSFPIVGIGASAGGLEAFERLFTHLPPDTGMAFTIIQHLDPTRESILTDLLQRFTRMPVTQVSVNMPVEPNHVYVIPPNANLELRGNELQLVKPTMPRGLRLPIDHFFRSLAASHGEKAICIILSGTGTDGTLGMKAIKEGGGLAIVESLESASYDGMPLSAINTGLVDMVLTPDKIAQQLMDYVRRSFVSKKRRTRPFAPGISDHLRKIFFRLRAHTGHDFSGYKENTIARRIERRMTVNQIAKVEDYLEYLQDSPSEIETLFRELLIGVTSFFRDHEAFEYLEEHIIPNLFAAVRDDQRQIRVWIPGCSTGEEAYSVAMLFQERMEKSTRPFEIQIFATDIDQSAMTKAREGRYPDSIAADVSPERLKRFFVREKDGNAYQVKRQIREMVVFAVQSVIKDPPFSKLDLICCRNLMIYLGSEWQQKVLSLFHYALNPSGFLFLGNSETLGNSQKLFHTVDQKWKIFQRAEFVSDIKTVLEFSGQAKRNAKALDTFPEKRVSAREVTEQMLLSEYVPTSVLINEKGEMLYIHGQTGRFLEQSTGEASTNILQTAREGLRMPLSTAIRHVCAQKTPQNIAAISVKCGKEVIRVQLSVAPVVKPAAMQGLMLVTLTEIPIPSDTDEQGSKVDYSQSQHILELEQELKSTREYLQTVIEELETTNEELKSSNEELQSSNEELQSTNEELETSKEELQSVNEELVTVNTELQSKVDELTFSNNDVKNLMDSVQVGILFLDTHLRIRRFTKASKQIVDLIPEDIGRPFKQFVHRLRYDRLIQDAQETLRTRRNKEVEVQSEDDAWYLVRFMPYRTVDDRVAGVVLTLTDFTRSKRAEEALRRSEEKFRAVGSNTPDHILMQDMQLRYEFVVNPQIGLTEKDMLGKTDHDFLSTEDADNLTRIKKQVLESGKPYHLEVPVRSRGGVQGYFDGSFIPKFDAEGRVNGLIGYFKDVTERKRVEEALRQSVENYRLLFAKNPNPMWVFDEETYRFLAVNDVTIKHYGYSREEFLAMTVLDVRPQEDRQLAERIIHETMNSQETRIGVLRHSRKDGKIMDMEVNASSIVYEGRPGRLCSMRDVTDRNRAEEALVESRALLRSYIDNLPALFFVKDLDGKLLDVNKAFETFFGIPAEQLMGKTDADFHGPEDVETVLANDRWVAETGKTLQVEEPTRLPDGEHVFLSTKFPIFNHNGAIVGTAGISFDITERKRAEEALRQSEARTQNILNTIVHGGQIIGHDWRYLYLNDAVVAHSGYESRQDLLGFTMMEKYPGIEKSELFGVLSRCMTERTSHRMESHFTYPDGSDGWFELSIHPVPEGLFILSYDVTDRKRLEAERQAREHQMVEDQRLQSLGLLAGGVAHDINNLLTPIWTNIELLRAQVGQGPDTAEMFDAVVAATQRARELVRQMLTFAGRHHMSFAQEDLNDLVTKNHTLLRASLPMNVVIQLELASEPLPLVADRTQIQQVVMNLILNAIDGFAGGAGTIFMRTRRQPSAQTASGSEVVLVVRDTGPGIAPEHMPRIFDPFFTTKTTGHGLGLSTTQGIIRAHRGQLEVQSVVGEGTTFTIRLPMDTVSPTRDVPQALVAPATLASESVWLIIDDEPLVRKSTSLLLKLLKVRTLQAGDGASGLALARQHAATLTGVVLDLTMPGMSGREVFQQLRAEFPTLPVVFLSGYSEHVVEDLMTLPKVVFLAKPYTPQALQQIILDLSK